MPPRAPSSPARLSAERSMIAAIQAEAGAAAGRRFGRQLRVGIGDDCAILRLPAGSELAVTTDMLLETAHFRRDWHSPESAGHRCLARGLSDLAAMGAEPLAAFLSVAIPTELAGSWMRRFLRGLLSLARSVGVPLAGGDTAQAPFVSGPALFSADILLLGSVPTGKALLRSGARPGDGVYVTGALGGSAAELASLAAQPARGLRLRTAKVGHPHLFPEPRLAQGCRLRTLASAAMDLSDGLSTDLAHLCEASGVRAEITALALPVHTRAQKLHDPLSLALHGGEDYELLFTAPEISRIPRAIKGVAVHRIGRILRARKGLPLVSLIQADGRREPLEPGGWEHFRSKPVQ